MWVMPMPEGSVTEAIQLTPPFDPSAGGQTLTAMVPHFVKDVRVYYEKRTGDRVKATWLDQSVNASPRRRMLLQNGTLPGTVANATNEDEESSAYETDEEEVGEEGVELELESPSHRR
ncbi:hypothetical protein PPROV_000666100 [Pycnococcus provasolii]|uniref:Uncharacterized protein n=1 Tax=Pycnococcus provasolii TaxID=41880 RepID=A0A830HSG6_9CHLO|nr:hypothetical protein PPROV_000666100 [Pycnococcus provasolii]